MSGDVNPIPEGFHTVTPHLVIKGAADAIEWYKKAFDATEIQRMPMPGGQGRLMHAMIRIGDSFIMLVDEMPEFGSKGPAALGGTPITINLYVEDADATFDQAVAAGANVTMPMEDTFWGDRFGTVKDPFGHSWGIMTHKRYVAPEDMMKAAEEMFAEME